MCLPPLAAAAAETHSGLKQPPRERALALDTPRPPHAPTDPLTLVHMAAAEGMSVRASYTDTQTAGAVGCAELEEGPAAGSGVAATLGPPLRLIAAYLFPPLGAKARIKPSTRPGMHMCHRLTVSIPLLSAGTDQPTTHPQRIARCPGSLSHSTTHSVCECGAWLPECVNAAPGCGLTPL